MKIMTFDLSTKSSGIAGGTNQSLEFHVCISISHRDVQKRIIYMRDEITKLIKQHCPDKIIMQQVRPQVNSRTNKVLTWLQGIITIAAYECNPKIQVQFMGASEWRATLKIHQGRGVKREQVKLRDIQYVKNKYNIDVNDDEADAICLFDSYWLKNDNEINWGD